MMRQPLKPDFNSPSDVIPAAVVNKEIMPFLGWGSAAASTLFTACSALKGLTIEKAENLLHRKNVDETLAFIQENPAVLDIAVEVKDIHGQRIKGTLLQILASAGEFNPIEMKPEEPPYGLLPLILSYFPDRDDLRDQLREWFSRPGEDATLQRMDRVREAIQTLIDEVADSKISDRDSLDEALLKGLRIAEKFRKAIQPDAKEVVTSGLVWDLQIFIDFMDIFKANSGRLGRTRTWSRKSDFVDAVVWLALQAESSVSHLEVYRKGICNVVDSGQLPSRLDFSRNRADLDGIGLSHFFGFYGDRFPVHAGLRPRGGGGGEAARGLFQNLCQTTASAIRSAYTLAESHPTLRGNAGI